MKGQDFIFYFSKLLIVRNIFRSYDCVRTAKLYGCDISMDIVTNLAMTCD